MTTFAQNRPPNQVLRLASPEEGDKRLTWIYLSREETILNYPDGSPSVIVFKLRYETFSPYALLRNGEFAGKYTASSNSVSMTNGWVFIDPPLRGLRLGTYCLREIALWAQQWPTADIEAIKLSEVDAGDKNRERRNTLYEKLGIMIDFADPIARRSGRSMPMKASELTPREFIPKNIEEFSLLDFLKSSRREIEDATDALAGKENAARHWKEKVQAWEARPIRTAASLLLEKTSVQVAILAAIIAGAYWLQR